MDNIDKQIAEKVEKMREMPFFFRFKYLATRNEQGRENKNSRPWRWLAEFISDSRDLYYKAEADTPAMAICLAALEAVKEKGDG